MPANDDFYPQEGKAEFVDVTGSSPDMSGEGHLLQKQAIGNSCSFGLLPRRRENLSVMGSDVSSVPCGEFS